MGHISRNGIPNVQDKKYLHHILISKRIRGNLSTKNYSHASLLISCMAVYLRSKPPLFSCDTLLLGNLGFYPIWQHESD